MKGMRMPVRKWWRTIGMAAVAAHIYSSLASAQQSIPTPSRSLAQGTNMMVTDDSERAMVRRILPEAMVILRDDKPLDPSNSVFGKLIDTEPQVGVQGNSYSFENSILPKTKIKFSTIDDPADCSADR